MLSDGAICDEKLLFTINWFYKLRILRLFQGELITRLEKLEKAVPALIAWNVVQVVGAKITFSEQVISVIYCILCTSLTN